MQQEPKHGPRFWLGNALYGKRDYKGSLAAFREFLAAAPQNPRAPEALLAASKAYSADGWLARDPEQAPARAYRRRGSSRPL